MNIKSFFEKVDVFFRRALLYGFAGLIVYLLIQFIQL